jgi:hypothetical protein
MAPAYRFGKSCYNLKSLNLQLPSQNLWSRYPKWGLWIAVDVATLVPDYLCPGFLMKYLVVVSFAARISLASENVPNIHHVDN